MGLTSIELFAGGGGSALGFHNAGFTPVLLSENNKDCVQTLRNNLDCLVDPRDVREIDFRGMNPDIVVGGFPCQSFSYIGKRKGMEDARGELYLELLRCVSETRPSIFIGENVKGLVTHHRGATLNIILNDFRKLGYTLNYKVLNAYNYSVPQKRERVFIVGTREDINPFDFPEPHSEKVNLREALKDVPFSVGQSYSAKKKKVLELVPQGKYWTCLPEDILIDYAGEKKASERHKGGTTRMARRLAWDKPAYTLLCSPQGKITDQCHPDETRPLRIREYARIQTFPDSWEFYGSTTSQYKQIGNAIPIKLAEAIALQAKNLLTHR